MTESNQSRIVEWFRRWRAPLRKFLASKNALRTADLDDVAQEVFLRLLRYNNAEFVEHPQAYLFKIASNVAAEWAIRSRHRLEHEPRWPDALVVEDSAEEEFDNAATQNEVKRALNTLTARERTVMRLYFEEGLSYAEIALKLGVGLRVVRRDFENSYGKLRCEIHLDRPGESHHGRK